MLRRAGLLGLAFTLAGCTEQVLLYDVAQEAGASDRGDAKDASWPTSDAIFCRQPVQYFLLNYQSRTPQIMVLLDRSASMQNPFDVGTRESVVQNALINVIDSYQTRVEFGFEQFPADTTESPCQPGTCCAGSVSVSPNVSNLGRMSNSILCTGPHYTDCVVASTDSPSYAALANVQEDKSFYSTDNPTEDRYILLVTSSEPSCAAEGHEVCTSALKSATDLGNNGVRIVVLSVGYQPSQASSCLYEISQTGSKLPLPANTKALYAAESSYELTNALTEFVSAVSRTACTLDFTTLPPSQAELSVSIGGNYPVLQTDGNTQDGWSFANTTNHTSIRLSGSACEYYMTTQYPIYIGYTCSPCDGAANACSMLWQ